MSVTELRKNLRKYKVLENEMKNAYKSSLSPGASVGPVWPSLF